MKKTIGLILFLCATLGQAQTNSTTLSLPGIQITGVSPNTVTMANDAISWLTPMWSDLTNGIVACDIAPLYGQKHFGEMADLRVSVSTNILDASIGLGEAYADTNFFVMPISLKLGTSIKAPVINRSVYVFAEEGASLQTHGMNLGNQTIVGATTSWDLSKNWNFNVEGGYLKLSQLSGNDWFFGVSFTYHTK